MMIVLLYVLFVLKGFVVCRPLLFGPAQKLQMTEYTRRETRVVNSLDLILLENTGAFGSDQFYWRSSYAPYKTLCPSSNLLRPANNVSS